MTQTPYPPIASYGLIGDMQSCALVSLQGAVDFACFPRFDSDAVFCRILDWERGGFFAVRPRGEYRSTHRYVPDTNVLETTFETADGAATLVDFMPVPGTTPMKPTESGLRQKICRVLTCTRGEIDFELECRPRFGYGAIVPTLHVEEQGTIGFAHGGAEALSLFSTAPVRIEDDAFVAAGRLKQGETLHAAVAHEESFSHMADQLNVPEIESWLRDTVGFWQNWASKSTYDGEYRDQVVRSALALKALTYAPSGAMVAAATTSLPEEVGGERNWDYRFTWIRDATLALYALEIVGYRDEAHAFNTWLEWSTGGRAEDLQPLYGIGGERRLTEFSLAGLSGYRGSTPVRIGNGAAGQFQLDIYGELLDSAHQYRQSGGEITPQYWEYLSRIVAYVIERWREPDDGIWETRGGRRHFVLSKVMCWVALDRAIKAARAHGLPADIKLWRRVRKEIRADVEAKGYDAERGAFVQAYGSKTLDASNLMLPLVGFIKATDPRMRSTIEATARELTSPQGFVYRYRGFDDGLSGTEGTFLICTFWLADNLIKLGEIERARALFERLRECANDLGLLGEQYDAETGEILGNFPQAFSHLGLINTAVLLDHVRKTGETAKKPTRSSMEH